MEQINAKNISINSASMAGTVRDFMDREEKRHGFYHIGRLRHLFLLLFIIHAPIAAIWLNIIPFEKRFHVFICVPALIISYCFYRRYSFHELGFRKDNLSGSMQGNMLFCAAGAVCLFFAYKAGLVRPHQQTEVLPYIYAIYVLFLAPAQEIVFRGILFAEMERNGITDTKLTLSLSTFSFCFLHIIYNHPPMLIIALISGLIWGILFTRWRNIWGISLSHSLLGALAIFLGVI